MPPKQTVHKEREARKRNRANARQKGNRLKRYHKNKEIEESELGVQQSGPLAAAPPPPLHHRSLLRVPASNLQR